MSVAQLRADSARIVEVLSGDLSAPVPSCPGWTLRDLVEHLGGIHRWACACVVSGAAPSGGPGADPADAPPTGSPDALAQWFAEGADALADALDSAGPDAATWTPFPIESPTVAVWIRRQVHETSLHRWDAESALGAPMPFDASLAADGVDEYLGVIVPRLVLRDGLVLPGGSAHLHCTDTEGEWTVEVVDGDYVLDRAHRKGDAAVRGAAQALLLRLWGRAVDPSLDGPLEVLGDAAVGEAWISLGGN